jgi:hypothetical protein
LSAPLPPQQPVWLRQDVATGNAHFSPVPPLALNEAVGPSGGVIPAHRSPSALTYGASPGLHALLRDGSDLHRLSNSASGESLTASTTASETTSGISRSGLLSDGIRDHHCMGPSASHLCFVPASSYAWVKTVRARARDAGKPLAATARRSGTGTWSPTAFISRRGGWLSSAVKTTTSAARRRTGSSESIQTTAHSCHTRSKLRGQEVRPRSPLDIACATKMARTAGCHAAARSSATTTAARSA